MYKIAQNSRRHSSWSWISRGMGTNICRLVMSPYSVCQHTGTFMAGDHAPLSGSEIDAKVIHQLNSQFFILSQALTKVLTLGNATSERSFLSPCAHQCGGWLWCLECRVHVPRSVLMGGFQQEKPQQNRRHTPHCCSYRLNMVRNIFQEYVSFSHLTLGPLNFRPIRSVQMRKDSSAVIGGFESTGIKPPASLQACAILWANCVVWGPQG